LEIAYLKLTNYRNFVEQKFVFSPEGALINGKNGIGKSNLLEAISYFAFGKSIQNRKDNDLINFSKAFFRIEGNFSINDNDYHISAAADRKKKIIKLNEANISRVSELYQYLKVVYFSPEDINIIGGAPSFRRNFIDQAISQYSYSYIELMRSYNRILKQRNALLKTEYDQSEKRSWDLNFAQLSTDIVDKRLKYLNEFIPLLIDYYNEISGDEEALSISYHYSFPYSGNDYNDELLNHLQESEEQEIQYERTLCGPHLDDIIFEINGHPARSFGSQGQKRSLSIAVRLVQARLISKSTEEFPVLMFDDVLADLDKQRSKKIMRLLGERHQIFIASPNAELYKDFNLQLIDLDESQTVIS
jgi:DNA replication and repair protein RecF